MISLKLLDVKISFINSVCPKQLLFKMAVSQLPLVLCHIVISDSLISSVC